MLEPIRLADCIQIATNATPKLPQALWGFYSALAAAGFSKSDALDLTRTFLQSFMAVPSPADVTKS
jgi:hypothetical protein